MNRKSTNNNNNSRFNFVNNELQKDKVVNEKAKETNVKTNIIKDKENMFKQRETNNRFNLDRLMEEPVNTKQDNIHPPPPNPYFRRINSAPESTVGHLGLVRSTELL